MVGPMPAGRRARSAGAGALGRAVGTVVAAGHRRGGRRLAPVPRQADRRERDPDLAEHLDRDEEAGEQEHDAQELAELEQLGRAEPVQRVGERSG